MARNKRRVRHRPASADGHRVGALRADPARPPAQFHFGCANLAVDSEMGDIIRTKSKLASGWVPKFNRSGAGGEIIRPGAPPGGPLLRRQTGPVRPLGSRCLGEPGSRRGKMAVLCLPGRRSRSAEDGSGGKCDIVVADSPGPWRFRALEGAGRTSTRPYRQIARAAISSAVHRTRPRSWVHGRIFVEANPRRREVALADGRRTFDHRTAKAAFFFFFFLGGPRWRRQQRNAAQWRRGASKMHQV